MNRTAAFIFAILLTGSLARAESVESLRSRGFALNAAPILFQGIPGIGGKKGSVGVFIGSSTVDSMEPFFESARELKNAGLTVLVVFDLDDTLLATAQDFPSSRWLLRELSVLHSCRPKLSPALLETRRQALLRVAGRARDASAWRLVPENGSRKIRELQDRGVRAVIITSRSSADQADTFRALRSMDIDMSRNPIGQDFDKTFKRATSYRNGVYFTSGQSRGQMLGTLLKQAGCALDAVLLIDDQGEHVNEVMASLRGGRISYHGFRYAEPGKNAGGESRDRAQLREFMNSGVLLDDDSADKLAATNPASPAEANTLIYGVDDPCGPGATTASSSE
ncbi:MAG: DUF2608 domain-containing protein [Elusimicrobiota bacterium]